MTLVRGSIEKFVGNCEGLHPINGGVTCEYMFPGHAGPIRKSVELLHTELHGKVQLPDGPVLPLPQRVHAGQGQALLWKDHRVRADSSHQIQDHYTRLQLPSAPALRASGNGVQLRGASLNKDSRFKGLDI